VVKDPINFWCPAAATTSERLNNPVHEFIAADHGRQGKEMAAGVRLRGKLGWTHGEFVATENFTGAVAIAGMCVPSPTATRLNYCGTGERQQCFRTWWVLVAGDGPSEDLGAAAAVAQSTPREREREREQEQEQEQERSGPGSLPCGCRFFYSFQQ